MLLQALAQGRVARDAAVGSMVLLRNEGDLLPLNSNAIGRVAVVGPNADNLSTQGGGSAAVAPFAT